MFPRAGQLKGLMNQELLSQNNQAPETQYGFKNQVSFLKPILFRKHILGRKEIFILPKVILREQH